MLSFGLRKRACAIMLGSVMLIGVSPSLFAQTIVAGSTTTGEPFTFVDPQSHKAAGLLVDVINEIAKEQDFNVEVKPMEWVAIIPGVTTGKLDLMVAGAIITPKRQEIMDFTNPIMPYKEGVIVSRKDHKKYHSIRDFSGMVVGVQGGTIYDDYAQKNKDILKEIRTYRSEFDVYRDISIGRIDFGIANRAISQYQIDKAGMHKELRVPSEYESAIGGYIGFAVKKGTHADLLAKLNAGIKSLQDSGRLKELQVKWHVADTTP